jgi:hypothetical protein
MLLPAVLHRASALSAGLGVASACSYYVAAAVPLRFVLHSRRYIGVRDLKRVVEGVNGLKRAGFAC